MKFGEIIIKITRNIYQITTLDSTKEDKCYENALEINSKQIL